MGATHEIALAPAAGTGLGKLLADDLLADGTLAREMGDVLRRGFRATRRSWDKNARTWCVEDDMRSQLQSVTIVLAQLVGEPARRVIHEHVSRGDLDPLEAIRASPELAEQLRRTLERATFRGRAAAARSAQAIDAEPAKAADLTVE